MHLSLNYGNVQGVLLTGTTAMQYIYGTPPPDSGAQWLESWAADTDLLYLEPAVLQQQ